MGRDDLAEPLGALRAEVDNYTLAAMHGLDATRLARTEDPIEALLFQVATARAVRFAEQRDEQNAIQIVNRLAESVNKGR